MEVQIIGWRYSWGGDSEHFPTRAAAREALAQSESLHPSYADKYVWPVTLNVYGSEEAALDARHGRSATTREP